MKIELPLIKQQDKENDRLIYDKSLLLSFNKKEINISVKTRFIVAPHMNTIEEKIEKIGVLEKENIKCFTDIFK